MDLSGILDDYGNRTLSFISEYRVNDRSLQSSLRKIICDINNDNSIAAVGEIDALRNKLEDSLSSRLYQYAAITEYKKYRFDKAISILGLAVNQNHKDIDLLILYGGYLLEQDRYYEGELHLEKDHKTNPVLALLFAKSLEMQDKEDKLFLSAKAYSTAGKLYHKIKNKKFAFDCYSKALSLDPECIDTKISLAHVQFDQEDLDGAIITLTKNISNLPISGKSLLAQAYLGKNNVDKSLLLFKEIYDNFEFLESQESQESQWYLSNRPHILYKVSLLYGKKGKFNEAYNVVADLPSIEDERYAQVHYSKAKILNSLGHSSDAIKRMRMLFFLYRSNPLYRFELGMMYAENGQTIKAQQELKYFIEENSNNNNKKIVSWIQEAKDTVQTLTEKVYSS